ncbi:MAG: hypothetical protein V1661_02175 [bacterium]
MFLFLRKYRKLILTFALVAGGVFIGANRALAVSFSPSEWALSAVGTIVSYYVQAIGKLTMLMIGILVKVASYNEFVNSAAVTEGWVIIRDVVNMFFILILLIIAFATIFNVREYKYQAMLPRLLIMAVVINFSRTIAGIFIDFGQVVMLTFVNGFQAAAGGNFINALRINDLTNFKADVETKDTSLGFVFAGFILAAIIITITLVVVVAMTMILVMRIVMLWFLIVLSPLAFMSSVWPGGKLKANYGKWWEMFIDNITIGPIMAFFLWLSLLVLGSGTIGKEFMGGDVSANLPSAAGTKIGTFENMISYLMGIGMLLGSLYMTKSMQAAGSGIAGKALGMVQGYATAGLRKAAMLPARGATRTAREAAVGGLELVNKIPLVGGFASRFTIKPLSRLQTAQKKQAQEDSAYISGLSKEQRAVRLKQLEKAAITDSQKNQKAALYRERLDDLSREEWKSDGKDTAGNETMKDKNTGITYTKAQWYTTKQDEYKNIKKFSEGYRVKDPEFGKKVSEFGDKDKRMDFLSDPEIMQRAGGLDAMSASTLKISVLKNDAVIEALGGENREYVKQHGGKVRRELIEDWESRKVDPSDKLRLDKVLSPVELEQMLSNDKRTDYLNNENVAKIPAIAQTPNVLQALEKAGRLDVLIKAGNINLENVAGGSNVARSIASSSNEALKERMRAKGGDEYKKNLREAIKIPGEHGAERAELLRMNENISSVYKIDAAGTFQNDAEENNFVGDIKKNRDILSKIGGQLTGEARQSAFNTLSQDELVKFVRRAKTDSEKDSVRKMIDNFKVAAKDEAASPAMKEIAEKLEGSQFFNRFVKESGGAGSAAPAGETPPATGGTDRGEGGVE